VGSQGRGHRHSASGGGGGRGGGRSGRSTFRADVRRGAEGGENLHVLPAARTSCSNERSAQPCARSGCARFSGTARGRSLKGVATRCAASLSPEAEGKGGRRSLSANLRGSLRRLAKAGLWLVGDRRRVLGPLGRYPVLQILLRWILAGTSASRRARAACSLAGRCARNRRRRRRRMSPRPKKALLAARRRPPRAQGRWATGRARFGLYLGACARGARTAPGQIAHRGRTATKWRVRPRLQGKASAGAFR